MNKAGTMKTIAIVLGILIFIAGFVVWTFSLSKTPILASSTMQCSVVLSDAAGLQTGSPVRISGLNIGSIESLVLQRHTDGKIVALATLTIEKKHLAVVKEPVIVSLGTVGILGDRFIDIQIATENSAAGQVLAPGVTLVAIPTMSIDKMTQLVGNTVERFQGISQRLESIFEETSQITKKLNQEGSVVQTLASKEVGRKLEETFSNLEQVSANANKTFTTINKGGGTLGALLKDRTLYNNLSTLTGAERTDLMSKAIEDIALAP